MAELVLRVAVMLSWFRFQIEPGAKVEMDIWLTLRPKSRVPVVISARQASGDRGEGAILGHRPAPGSEILACVAGEKAAIGVTIG